MQALGQTAILSSLLLVAPVLSSFHFFFFFCLKCLCCLTLVADDDDDDDDDDRYDVMPQRIPLHFYAHFVCVCFISPFRFNMLDSDSGHI